MGVIVSSPGRTDHHSENEDRGLSFEELVARYERRIYNLILRQVGDPEDAADLAQETFVKAFRAFGQFRGESSVFTWLCRIALNLCKNRFRQRDRMRSVAGVSIEEMAESEEPGQAPQEVPDWSQSPERLYEQRELADRVQEAIANLPREYREVVVLRDLQHLSYQEIAQVTGLTLENVKTRLHRGRLMLRRMLEPYVHG
ncbi:MAG: sigma-70 family RNA polymerase sigma factor [Armatimonadota bacterium]